MKWGIISKAILILNLVILFSYPASAEMGMSGGEFVSPRYFIDNSKAAEVRTKADGQLEYEIYIPSEIVPGYKIHSNYNNKTDACASCHSTHTSVGASLLQWRTVSEVCFACHDGTVTTTYNVVEGNFKIQGSSEYYTSSGGCFTEDDNDRNASWHNVDDEVQNSGAPGGYRGSDYSNNGPIKVNNVIVSWKLNFSCASCHNPHGEGGNARLLKPDVNGVAMQNQLNNVQMFQVDSNDGTKWSVFPDIDSDNEPEKYFDNGRVGDSGYRQDFSKQVRAYNLVRSYPYNKNIAIDLYYKGTNTFYKNVPFEEKQMSNLNGTTVFSFDTDISNGGQYIVKISKAYPGITVGMRIDNYLNEGEFVEYKYGINAFCGACHRDYNTAATKGDYESVKGTESKFMQVDNEKSYFLQYPSQYSYFSGSGGAAGQMSGAYSNAYRHQVGMVWDGKNKINGLKFERDTWNSTKSIQGDVSGKMVVNCLTCHVAHGVSTDYWQRTVGEGEEDNAISYHEYNVDFGPLDSKDDARYESEKYPLKILSNDDVSLKKLEYGEISGSSVLKRFPNMGVCEACHQKGKDNASDAFNNNPNHEIHN